MAVVSPALLLSDLIMSKQANNKDQSLFVTVGTTRFDKLVHAATSPMALEWMASQGYTSLTVQYGTGQAPTLPEHPSVTIRAYNFLPTLQEDMKQADLILSHAGAGTVMEALRLHKKLVVVINTLLMDNHQTELASAMATREHLFVVEKPETLDQMATWKSFETFVPIPHKGGDAFDFPRLLDAHFGFEKEE